MTVVDDSFWQAAAVLHPTFTPLVFPVVGKTGLAVQKCLFIATRLNDNRMRKMGFRSAPYSSNDALCNDQPLCSQTVFWYQAVTCLTSSNYIYVYAIEQPNQVFTGTSSH